MSSETPTPPHDGFPQGRPTEMQDILLSPPTGSRPATTPGQPWQPPTPQELQAMVPQYEILCLLGRGGMGAVYQGRQISLDRLVAIKILSNDLEEADANFAERFKNEARAMAKLTHPGIVSVYDFGETPSGLLYIVMEFVEGTDVQKMISANKRLHTEHAMAITAHVCDALAYAHERGIIHRDIKPANIMVGYDGSVKVADFGLAKVSTGGQTVGLTQSGIAMGTLHFMAPEALTLGSSVDHRADIYAVGVMLYQMLTGKLPQGMFELPSIQVQGLDPRYDGIIAQALREDRDVRYQSAKAMRLALDAILTQPVVKLEPAQIGAAQQPAVAVLPTQARPQRPGGQPYRPPQPRPQIAPPPPARSFAWVWVLFFLLAGAAWFFFFKPQEPKAPNVAVESAPNVTTLPTVTPQPIAQIRLLTPDAVRVLKLEKDQPRLYDSNPLRVIEGVAAGLKDWQFTSIPQRIDNEYTIRVEKPGVIYAFGAFHKGTTPQDSLGSDAASWVNAEGDITGAMVKFCYKRNVSAGETLKFKAFELQFAAPDITLEITHASAATSTPVPPTVVPSSPKAAVVRRPWPADTNFRSEGRFRAWSSVPNDPKLDLTKLQGVDDAAQVYVNSTGWLVVRRTGDVISDLSGADGLKDIRRVCRGNANEFALITNQGKLIVFPPRTDSTNRIPDGLGPVRDIYISSFRQVAILEDGSLVAWGSAHDGINTPGNGEWKDKPVLPTGRKAATMSNTIAAMGLRTDDGKILRWGYTGGFSRSPGELDADPETPFLMNNMAIFAVPKTTGPILIANWRGNDPATPFAGDIRGRDFISANNEEKHIVLLDLDGRLVLDPMCEDRSITAALDLVTLAERDLVSVHFSDKSQPATRFFWFDKAAPSSPASSLSTSPPAAAPLLAVPDFHTRVANYQKARHAQLATLTANYRAAMAKEKTAATKTGVLANVTAADAAIANAAAFAQLIEANLTATEVKPLPTLAAVADPAPPRLKELRDIFAREVAKIETTLVVSLDQSLATVQASLVKADNLTAAKAMEAYRQQMMAAFKTTQPAPAASVAGSSSVTSTTIHQATKDRPFVNSLGMKFVPVPGTKVLMCIHETRYRDYTAHAANSQAGHDAWKDQNLEGVAIAERSEDHPVVNVDWNDAQRFCFWISGKEPGLTYRLPTDLEWNFGVGLDRFKHDDGTTPVMRYRKDPPMYPWGGGFPPRNSDKAGNYADAAWHEKHPEKTGIDGYTDGYPTTAPVMSFQPNKLGLYDMGGNVWEWCDDWFDDAQTERVLRGASWDYPDSRILLSSYRARNVPSARFHNRGFRIVLELP